MYAAFRRHASTLYYGMSLLLATACLPVHASAQTTHDTQFWYQAVGTIGLPGEWRLHTEGQLRSSQEASELDHSIVRWAVGHPISRRVVLWAGHAWIPRTLGSLTRHEQRLWQQASVTVPDTGRWRHALRFRLEQRFQEPWADSSHRIRSMARTVRPVRGRWSLVAWDELMLNFDATEGGPRRGFDRNRFFGGSLWQASRRVGLETGYLLQTSGPSTARLHDHTAVVWTNLSF